MSTTTIAHFPKSISRSKYFDKDYRSWTDNAWTDCARYRERTDYYFHGAKIENKTGAGIGFQLIISGELKPNLNPNLTQAADFFSVRCTDIPSTPHRKSGIYRHPSDKETEATVMHKDQNSTFTGKGSNLDLLFDLLRLVRAGTILPEEDWDAEQITPKSKRETIPIDIGDLASA